MGLQIFAASTIHRVVYMFACGPAAVRISASDSTWNRCLFSIRPAISETEMNKQISVRSTGRVALQIGLTTRQVPYVLE